MTGKVRQGPLTDYDDRTPFRLVKRGGGRFGFYLSLLSETRFTFRFTFNLR